MFLSCLVNKQKNFCYNSRSEVRIETRSDCPRKLTFGTEVQTHMLLQKTLLTKVSVFAYNKHFFAKIVPLLNAMYGSSFKDFLVLLSDFIR